MGMCMSEIWSISALPSALDSSSGCAMGWAAARQCLQARSQDCVTSQMARNGVSSKFNAPRAGILCIGCIRPPGESRQARVENPVRERCGSSPEEQPKHEQGCDLDQFPAFAQNSDGKGQPPL